MLRNVFLALIQSRNNMFSMIAWPKLPPPNTWPPSWLTSFPWQPLSKLKRWCRIAENWLLTVSQWYYASLILSSALQQAHVWCGHRKKGHFKKMEVKLPSLSKKWLNCMVSCLHLQEIPYTVSSSSTKFKKIWGLFIEHIRREWPKGGNWLCFIYFFLYICVFLYVAVVHCTVLVFYLHLGLWYPNYSRPALIPFGPGLLVFIFFILYLFFISGHSWASC